jgi:hypothetical protein
VTPTAISSVRGRSEQHNDVAPCLADLLLAVGVTLRPQHLLGTPRRGEPSQAELVSQEEITHTQSR